MKLVTKLNLALQNVKRERPATMLGMDNIARIFMASALWIITEENRNPSTKILFKHEEKLRAYAIGNKILDAKEDVQLEDADCTILTKALRFSDYPTFIEAQLLECITDVPKEDVDPQKSS